MQFSVNGMASGGAAIKAAEFSRDSFSTVHHQGYAVFIVNIEPTGEKGDFEFQTRVGAREDGGSLQTVFIDKLGFEWTNPTAYWHQNLPLGRWDHRKDLCEQKSNQKECCLRCHIQSLDHSRSDCFVLAISSHGRELTETEIVFSDGKSLYLTEIFDALSDKNCPSLKGKPRIIILQACRSNFRDKERVEKMQDRGCYTDVEVSGNERDMAANQTGKNMAANRTGPNIAAEGNGTEMLGRSTVETEDVTFQQIALNKMPENFLLVYPAVSGQRSQRSENYGSWLIYALKEELLKKHVETGPINFLHLLTDAAGYIARERETIAYEHEEGTQNIKKDESGNKIIDAARSGLKNAVCFHHRLLRPLIFYPKVKDKVELHDPFNPTGKKKKKITNFK